MVIKKTKQYFETELKKGRCKEEILRDLNESLYKFLETGEANKDSFFKSKTFKNLLIAVGVISTIGIVWYLYKQSQAASQQTPPQQAPASQSALSNRQELQLARRLQCCIENIDMSIRNGEIENIYMSILGEQEREQRIQQGQELVQRLQACIRQIDMGVQNDIDGA